LAGDSDPSFGFNPLRCASKCHMTTFAPPLTVAVTLSDAFPLIPLRDAVTIVEPAVTPVAMPLELVVATDEDTTIQLAVELTSAVEPSL
jgi:hypothetical protein